MLVPSTCRRSLHWGRDGRRTSAVFNLLPAPVNRDDLLLAEPVLLHSSVPSCGGSTLPKSEVFSGAQVKQYPEHLKGNTALLNLLRSRGRLKNHEVASVSGEICEYFRQFFSPRSRYYVSTFTTSALLLQI
jgi:hypothetical protein